MMHLHLEGITKSFPGVVANCGITLNVHKGEIHALSLLLDDCTGATDEGNSRAGLKMLKMQEGVFGSVSNARDLILALRPLHGMARADSLGAPDGQ